MAHKDDLAAPLSARPWTRPDDYLGALARRRTARRSRERRDKVRTEPEAPRFTLSTLPFMALMVSLAVLTIAIFIAAMPKASEPIRAAPEAKAPGTAAKGWFQEAQRQFKG